MIRISAQAYVYEASLRETIMLDCSNHITISFPFHVQAERLKQEAVKKQQESLQMAKDHHLKSLLKFYGLRPWLKFMSDVRQLQSKAIESNDQRLIRCLFKRWLHCWKVREQGRLERADTLYRLHLLRSHLNTWLKVSSDSRPCWKTLKSVYRNWVQ